MEPESATAFWILSITLKRPAEGSSPMKSPPDVPAISRNVMRTAPRQKRLGWEAQYTLKDMCEDSWRWQKKQSNGYED